MNCLNCNHPQEEHGQSGCYHIDTIGVYPDDHMDCCHCGMEPHDITISALTAQNEELLAGLDRMVKEFSGAPETHTELCALWHARQLLTKYGGK
jgi:hypothetical protein